MSLCRPLPDDLIHQASTHIANIVVNAPIIVGIEPVSLFVNRALFNMKVARTRHKLCTSWEQKATFVHTHVN
jgi:hypothetical protein